MAPLEAFRSLYDRLNLDFNLAAQQKIHESSSDENPSEIVSAHSIHVNSSLNIHHWKQRLSADEIDRIRRITAGVADDYYPDSSWQVSDRSLQASVH